jgi:hypothetical protein
VRGDSNGTRSQTTDHPRCNRAGPRLSGAWLHRLPTRSRNGGFVATGGVRPGAALECTPSGDVAPLPRARPRQMPCVDRDRGHRRRWFTHRASRTRQRGRVTDSLLHPLDRLPTRLPSGAASSAAARATLSTNLSAVATAAAVAPG